MPLDAGNAARARPRMADDEVDELAIRVAPLLSRVSAELLADVEAEFRASGLMPPDASP